MENTNVPADTTSAKEKLKAKVDGWKKEAKDSNEIAEREVQNALQNISKNSKLAGMYNQSSQMGTEGIQSSAPTLKLHIANKSKGDILENGEEANDGWFFYGKTKQQFQNPLVRIFNITRGFYAKGMEDESTGEKKDRVFNQIVSGVILDEGELLPFILYFTGSKLQNLWNFAKDIEFLTKAKPVGIPMFALTVKLSREKKDIGSKYGPVNMIKFELVKDGEGSPLLIDNPEEFEFIRDLVIKMKPRVDEIVEKKDVDNKDSQGNVIQDIPFAEEEPAEGEEVREEPPFN